MDGYTVTSIGDGKNRVINPDNTHSIMEKSISVLEIPSTVTVINDYAFENCSSIEKVIFGNRLQSIGNYAFRNTVNLHSTGAEPYNLALPDSLINIGNYAFEINYDSHFIIENNDKVVAHSSSKLAWSSWVPETLSLYKKITLGTHITTIGNFAFAGSQVQSISIPQNVNKIGDGAFAQCCWLSNITFEDRSSVNNLSVGNFAFSGLTYGIESISISNKLSLGTGVFADNDNLKEVIIENGVNSIGSKLFKNCQSLTNITNSSTITEIGSSAFSSCYSLTTQSYNNITKDAPTINSYAFEKCIGLTGTININSTKIYEGIFSECSNIENVNITSNITSIPTKCFYRCRSLSNIEMPSSITIINSYAFYGCSSITLEVLQEKILKNIVTIGNYAFAKLNGLEGELVISEPISTIGESAFRSCNNITSIKFTGNTLKSIGDYAFFGASANLGVLRFPSTQLSSIGRNVFRQMDEAFFSKTTVSLYERWYGYLDVFVHFGNCKHNIDVSCSLPGVSVIDANTNANFGGKYTCESNQTFKVVIQDGYSYPDLAVKVISQGKYTDDESIEEFVTLNENNEYTFENLTRDKKIIIQKNKDGTDLVLKQYITEINNSKISKSRKPEIRVGGLSNISYYHSKTAVAVNTGDLVTYTIRIYNEGNYAGKANSVSVKLQTGLNFKNANEINTLFGWQVSDDGRTITTNYLADKEIEKYPGYGKPNFEELQFVLEVGEQKETIQNIVTLAEISDGNDIDSIPNNMDEIDITNSDIICPEDDTDFEKVILKAYVKTGYNLIIKKIDSTSSELLNGAEFKLYNENKEEIATQFTQNGELNFGNFSTFGEGEDIYYIEEVGTPIGYKKTFEGLMKIIVQKTTNDSGELAISIICDIKDVIFPVEDTRNVNVKNYIPITNAEELSKIGSNETVKIGEKTYVFSEDANYILENDITLSQWVPINSMNGVFNGNNHKISNLTISSDTIAEVGLFRTFSGTMMNVTLQDVNINITDSIEENSMLPGGSKIGALAGYMENATIKNCTVTGGNITYAGRNVGGLVGYTGDDIIIEDSISDLSSIQGDYNVGGFVGCSMGKIVIKNSENKSNIEFKDYNAGGLIGNANNNAYIRSCKNSAVISAVEDDTKDRSNAGGLIGYFSEGNNLLIEKCNNTGNITGVNNIGGLVGFSEGYTNIVECSNTAEIVSEGYNAGGLLGYGFAKNTKPESTTIVYDNDSKSIIVYLKNKETTGSYDLKIQKVDMQLFKTKLATTLTGAKFNVYDYNKQVLMENAEVNEKGELLIDSIPISSIGTDIYYIKEVEAPKGYDILVHDYVKVEVSKIWDSVNEKYTIQATANLTDEINDVEKEDETAKTGKTEKPETSTNVIYATNGINVYNSNNSGTITVAYTGAGGMLGTTRCNVNLEECTNTGNISGINIGGIAGDLKSYSKDLIVNIEACENNSEEISGGGFVGGILGVTSNKLNMYDCSNSSVINSVAMDSMYKEGGSHPVSAGIVGGAIKETIIENCENTGHIDLNGLSEVAGGIVGNSLGIEPVYNLLDKNDTNRLYIENVYLEVFNCNNTGNIGASTQSDGTVNKTGSFSNSHSGGIVGRTEALRNKVINCKNENNVINGSINSGGIIGGHFAEESTIKKCTVNNSNVRSQNQVSGVIGTTGGYRYSGTGSYYFNNIQKITVEDSKIIDCYIISSGGYNGLASGVIPSIDYYSSTGLHDIKIKGVEILGTQENEPQMVISSSTGCAAGILGSVYNCYNTTNIQIQNCNVKNAMISSQSDVAGIMGKCWNGGDDVNYASYSFINNNVDNVFIYGKGTAGGIFGDAMNSGVVDGGFSSLEYIFEGCTVSNAKITSGSTSYSSIGGIAGHIYTAKYASINNCNVNNINITSNSSNDDSGIGGILGGTYNGSYDYYDNSKRGEYIISNCNVNGFDIISTVGDIGGLIGYAWTEAELNINNCNVIGQKGDGTKSTIMGLSPHVKNVGGAIGMAYMNNQINISNCEVSDILFGKKENDDYTSILFGENLGGFMGSLNNAPSGSNVEKCKVSNIEVFAPTRTLYGRRENRCFGGFSGSIYSLIDNGQTNTINDIEVNNVSITSSLGNTSGGLGYMIGWMAENLSFNNINIKHEADNLSEATGGVIAVYNPYSYNGHFLNNVKLQDMNINATINEKMHMGGLIGVTGKGSVSNIDAKNITINNVSSGGTTGGIIGVVIKDSRLDIEKVQEDNITVNGKYATGSILGCGTTYMSNVTVNNPIVTSSTIAGGGIGISVENSVVQDVKITTKDSNNTKYGVFSNIIAGGLMAFNSGFADDCVLENIIVKVQVAQKEATNDTSLENTESEQTSQEGEQTGDETGDATGGNEQVREEFAYPKDGMADAIAAYFYKETLNCIIKNVTVINGAVSEVVNTEE